MWAKVTAIAAVGMLFIALGTWAANDRLSLGDSVKVHDSRLAVLESQRQEDRQRLERIEAKLDLLLARPEVHRR